jgi:hypothetical protein
MKKIQKLELYVIALQGSRENEGEQPYILVDNTRRGIAPWLHLNGEKIQRNCYDLRIIRVDNGTTQFYNTTTSTTSTLLDRSGKYIVAF